jgi:hypothetical protein
VKYLFTREHPPCHLKNSIIPTPMNVKGRCREEEEEEEEGGCGVEEAPGQTAPS